ncbi:MAG TPA: hypothetical protein VL523_09910 [Terriglobia bacterium]|nr:hypothetical protein [Terriglobia bacterium]
MPSNLTEERAERLAWTSVLPRAEPLAGAAVKEYAAAAGASERDLRKQVLLHLPRFTPAEIERPDCVRAETERLGERLRARRLPYDDWAGHSRIERLETKSLRFGPVDDRVARVVHERFHYIGTFRAGRHLGLFLPGSANVPLALLTLSPMDLTNLAEMFPSQDDRDRVRVLSRLFAFDYAPRNTMSYLMGQARKWLRAELPQVGTLLTYLNPNLEFTGASYQASNWRPLLEVPARYAYLHGDYITFRSLMGLAPLKRAAVRYSQYRLQPLKLLRDELHRNTAPRPIAARRAAIPYLAGGTADAVLLHRR